MLTPDQQQAFTSAVQGGGQNIGALYQQLLQPQGVEDYQQLFQQSYIDPAMNALNQQIIPGLKQQFGDMDAGSSSALNQALAQSAADISTNIGQNIGNFMQQQQGNQLSALGQYQGLLGQETFTPLLKQNQGILPGLIALLAKSQ